MSGSAAAEAMARLEPMPVEGPLGLFGCLPYWFKVLGARLKRGRVISTFRQEISTEQRRMDEILRDLGKRAREVDLQQPELAAMGQLRALEQQQGQIETDSVGLGEQVKQAEATFEEISTDCNARSQTAQQEASATQATLNEKKTKLNGLKTQLAQVDRELNKLAAALRAKTAQGAKSQDPAQQEALEQEAVNITARIEHLEGQRKGLESQTAELEGPVNELTAQLTDARTRLHTAQQELAVARQQLATAKRSLGAEGQKKGQEMARLDREMAHKFLEIGQQLDADRVQESAFEELYGRIDDARQGLAGREQQIANLEAERGSYDQPASKKGLILLLSAAGLVLAIIAVLIILFTVVFD